MKQFKIKNLKFKIKKLLFIPSAILLALAGIFIYSYFNTQSASAAWWDDTWSFRKSIAITAHTASENNVYINLTGASDLDTSDTTKFQTDCGDLRFTKSNGELLPYYIVSGCGTNATVVHVNFDVFPAGAQTIYYYYGNPSASDGFNPADFSTEASSYTLGSQGSEEKSNGPAGYWSLDDGQGSTAQDSSVNNNDGSISGAAWKTEDNCVASKCLYFDGSNDYASMGTGSSLLFGTGDHTVSFWMRGSSTNTQDLILKQDATGGGWSIYLYSSGQIWIKYTDGTNSVDNSLITTAVTDNKWHYITVVFNHGGNAVGYVDGVQKGTRSISSVTGSTDNASRALSITNNSNPYKGFIDEVKIYPYARTAAQIKQDFASKAGASADQGSSAVLGAKSQKHLSDGLVGYWKMDEASANSCSGGSNDSCDSSGNGNDMAWDTNAPSSSTGKFGNGLDFEDTSSQFMSVSDTNSLSITSNLTLSTWVNLESINVNGSPIITKDGSSTNSSFYILITSTGNIRFLLSSNGSTRVYRDSSSTLNTGTWYHVLGVYDATAQTMNIYLNGTLNNGSLTGTVPSNIHDGNAATRIGSDQRLGAGYFMDGKLDDARIYNRALSPKEISDLYNWAPGPVGYWDFEEGSGVSANDSSGNGQTATLTNNPTWVNGKYGNGVDLDGTDDHLTHGLQLAKSSGTIEHWLKADQLRTMVAYYESDGTADGSYNGFGIGGVDGLEIHTGINPSNQWYALYQDGASSGGTFDVNGSAATANQWTHIAMTWDRSGSLILYVNGVKAGSSIISGGTFTSRTATIKQIGRTGDGTTARHWDGQIDEVKVYNYARTQKQIVEDMNGGHPAGGSPVGSQVGYWKFDEGYGQTANNSGSQGSTLNGIFGADSSASTDDPSWTSAGKYGKALSFDGGDYVKVTDATALKPADAITLSAWFNATDKTVDQRIVSKTEGGSYQISLSEDDACGSNTLCFLINIGGTYKKTALADSNISNSTWYHVVGTYDGAYVRLYVNGVLKEATAATGTITHSTTPLCIGAESTTGACTGGKNFTGLIDEVKVYDYALTADEIKLDYNRGSSLVLGTLGNLSTLSNSATGQEYCIPGDSSTCTAPVGEWNFEEGNGASVNDISGNGLTGTWNGTGQHWSSGKIGKAGKFNGTDDYITSTWDPTSTSGTIEAWINIDSGGSGIRTLFSVGDINSNYYWIVFQIKADGTLQGYAEIGGSTRWQLYTDSALPTDKWLHVALVQNNTSPVLYVNGVRVAQTFGATQPDKGAWWDEVTATTMTCIGCSAGKSAANGPYYIPFKGGIDQVKVFDYARTAAQITWDYNRGKPVGHWDFDECEGTILHDLSDNKNNGTITIGAAGTQAAVGTCSSSGTAWGNGATGKKNASLNFGTSDDYTQVSTNSMMSGTGSRSVSVWIYPGSSEGSQNILSTGDCDEGNLFMIGYDVGAISNEGIYFLGGSFNVVSGNANTITRSAWNHVTIVYDGNTAISIFVNGRLNKAGNLSQSLDIASAVINIAKSDSCVSLSSFKGQIDELKIFNYALTSTQVKDLYNDGAVRYGPLTGSP